MKQISKEFLDSIKEKLQDCNTGDTKIDHVIADQSLCDLLIELGYKDIVNLYLTVDKRFA